MKIAVCFSGQPRTWKQCYKSWDNLFSRFVAEIDYFYHLWNFNSLPQADTVIPQYISQEEIYEIEAILKPKKMMIDDYDKNRQVIRDVRELGNHYPHLGGTPVYHTGAQLYSHMQSARLKRQYEIENNFEYDVCFRLSTSTTITDDINCKIIDEFKITNDKDIYLANAIKTFEFPYNLINYDLFFANSQTFDVTCSMYNIIPLLKTENFPKNISINYMFGYFLKMFDMKINRLNIITKNIQKLL